MMTDAPHSVPNPAGSSLGMRRQFEIYQLGLAGKKLSVPIPLAQLEKKAAEVLTPPAYDYVAGGASGERTLCANLAAFDRWRIVPRMLRDVSERDLSLNSWAALCLRPFCWLPSECRAFFIPPPTLPRAALPLRSESLSS